MGWPPHVFCADCGARVTGRGFDEVGEQNAIDKWNQRAGCAKRSWWKWLTREEAKAYAPFGIVWSNENWICFECGNYKGGKSPEIMDRMQYCDKCGAIMGTKGVI